MDPPLPLPPLLERTPPPLSVLREQPHHSLHGTLHAFDLESQSAPLCGAFRGIRVYRDAISEQEAQALLAEIDSAPFKPAQSGKFKQHYGPRINFNKRKMNVSAFRGLPAYASRIEAIAKACLTADVRGCTRERADCREALERFETTDVFVLRYLEEAASNLDFHRDDTFGYGEAILDLSLDSDSILTFRREVTHDVESTDLRPTERPTERRAGDEHYRGGSAFADRASSDGTAPHFEVVRVPLPARSLAVLYGAARFEWEHAVLPYDIESVRTSITLRTLSEPLRSTPEGQHLLTVSRGGALPAPRP